jgi:hypothetical protein
MAFLEKLTTLFFKIEGTPYTAETSFAATDSLPCEGIEFSPEIPVAERKIAFGDFGYCSSVAGKRSGTVKFSVPIGYIGAGATPPKYFELLRACGLKQTIHGTSGVSLTTSALYTNVPMSIAIDFINEGSTPTIKRHSLHGCMGNATITGGNVGEYAKIEFEFKGAYDGDSDIAYAAYSYPSFSCYSPEVVLSVGMTANSVSQGANSFTINLNNDVQLFSDLTKSTGFSGAHLVGQHPTIEIDPDLLTVASEDIFSQVTANSTFAFSLQFANPIIISAPKVQLTSLGAGSREGHYTATKKFECQRNAASDAVITFLHGSTT